LGRLGRIYAGFAAAADVVEGGDGDGDGGGGGGLVSGRERDMGRIFQAMTRYPELVGGEGRFCTALMRVYQGMLIGKVGADGCYGVGIRASEDTRRLGADGAIGIAVKIEDGNREVLYSAVVEILAQLDIGTPEMRRELAKFHRPNIVNTAGVVTGSYTHRFLLASP
jgi:L-asparaginase II